MSGTEYKPPTLNENTFNCGHCGAFALQIWGDMFIQGPGGLGAQSGWRAARCVSCTGLSIWHGAKMHYPRLSRAPLPNPDLPAEIAADFEEARAILNISPRGAAALLRLCIQKLCAVLGQKGKNINDDIGALVKLGLLPSVQQSLDSVRVIGNNAVHPGQIDLQDNDAVAMALFRLVNLIVTQMITGPKEAAAVYNSLPVGTLAAIAKRDGQP